MRRKVTVESDEFSIGEVKTVWSDQEVNELLAQGWIMLHGGVAHKDTAGYQAKPVFVLGKIRAATK